ncbi:MAG: hypothetical protein CVU09_01980 [Bacteroidetes bacterium HGW-Bacteroidetes-4]|jgi:hypothetical protein|nr:MAG: hypothetical protein CVU09_01980 [Bacteroidetes bacterium HGW-Bacteroidetes-4]
MRYLLLTLITVVGLSTNSGCTNATKRTEQTANISARGVNVYYFHYSRRCLTCNAVETVSKSALSELFNNKVNFTSYNLDEADGESKGKELEISGQTLLVVSGETRINLTNEGFMHARNNPEKLKAILKEKIEPLLKQ